MNYFPNSALWRDFWLSQNTDHTIKKDEYEYDTETITSYCFKYPTLFGRCFWYIHQAPHTQSEIKDTALLTSWMEHIRKEAKKHNISFVRFNLPSELGIQFSLTDQASTWKWFQSHISYKQCKPSPRIQLYCWTVLLSLEGVQTVDITKYTKSESLLDWMEDSKEFWSKRNKDIRNGTRRACKFGWNISYKSSDECFEDFWQVYTETTQRQSFGGHPKSYLYAQWKHENTRTVVVYDSDGNPHGAWIGWLGDSILTYLHGGNTAYGLKNFSQYLIHAIGVAISQHEKKEYYDLGGYIPNTGYGTFKDKYKGELVYFPGPLDMVIQPFWYNCITTAQRISKTLKQS